MPVPRDAKKPAGKKPAKERENVPAGPERKAVSLLDFVHIRKICTGRYGDIVYVRDKRSNQCLVLKHIQLHRLDQASLVRLRNEVELQKELRHPNILRAYGYFRDPKERRLFIMVAHADGGTMLQFIKDQPKGRLSEEVAANFAMQMTLGLQYLHDVAKVIHRDIHAENILLDKGVLKIADFGCCVQDDSRVRTTMCGTLDYLAPERLTGRSYDYRVDLWALGVLVTEFLIGKATFQAGEDDCVVVRILNLELRFPSYLSKDARGLIQKLLRLDPDDRLPLDKVLERLRGPPAIWSLSAPSAPG